MNSYIYIYVCNIIYNTYIYINIEELVFQGVNYTARVLPPSFNGGIAGFTTKLTFCINVYI